MHAARAASLIAVVVAACGGTSFDPTDGPCTDYCRLVMRNCIGADSQYSAIDLCEATCATMEVGDPTQTSGNTIECRTFWAAIAEGDKTACVKAGPGGDGQCGDNCDSFCNATLDICADQPVPPYPSKDACLAACTGFAAEPPYNANEVMGDTLACRIYHMTAASTDPDLHCQHTGVVSDTCF
ncbi:MAG TPA: hypothetical protein VM734_26230 [Kofleriaceae bacterium]|jgi:hypothetical protein|nr:hypothetical protein [Kofleriaceae bacterium]